MPSSPGGGTDISARVIADHLGRAFKGQFFVENRPGAGQSIGIEVAARSEPDGYTLLMAASTLALNPIMYKNIKYDPVKDFAPISQVASIPNVVLVHPSVPAKTLKELIALAKSKPGELTYASAGIGTSPHMGMELLKHMAGVDIQHIPFRGSGPAVTETISGRVNITLASTLQAKPFVEGGQLRALAVTTGKRWSQLPNVPTIAEASTPPASSSPLPQDPAEAAFEPVQAPPRIAPALPAKSAPAVEPVAAAPEPAPPSAAGRSRSVPGPPTVLASRSRSFAPAGQSRRSPITPRVIRAN